MLSDCLMIIPTLAELVAAQGNIGERETVLMYMHLAATEQQKVQPDSLTASQSPIAKDQKQARLPSSV